MGLALIAKPALSLNISVITFGIAQVVMDIEPVIGILTGAEVLHGPTHTILGALVMGFLVMLDAALIQTDKLLPQQELCALYGSVCGLVPSGPSWGSARCPCGRSSLQGAPPTCSPCCAARGQRPLSRSA